MADELRLVDTVLIAAAKMAAMSSPVTPDGSADTMNHGKTKSARSGPR